MANLTEIITAQEVTFNSTDTPDTTFDQTITIETISLETATPEKTPTVISIETETPEITVTETIITTNSETTFSDTTISKTTLPETTMSGTTFPEATMSDTIYPETAMSETKTSETPLSETNFLDTKTTLPVPTITTNTARQTDTTKPETEITNKTTSVTNTLKTVTTIPDTTECSRSPKLNTYTTLGSNSTAITATTLSTAPTLPAPNITETTVSDTAVPITNLQSTTLELTTMPKTTVPITTQIAGNKNESVLSTETTSFTNTEYNGNSTSTEMEKTTVFNGGCTCSPTIKLQTTKIVHETTTIKITTNTEPISKASGCTCTTSAVTIENTSTKRNYTLSDSTTKTIPKSTLTNTTNPVAENNTQETALPENITATEMENVASSLNFTLTIVTNASLNALSTTKICASTYPKHCEMPVSWETTVKGETRDFFQILRDRYGKRGGNVFRRIFSPLSVMKKNITILHYFEERNKILMPLHPCILADICNHTWLPECGHYAKTNTLRIFTDECDMFEYNCDNTKDYKLTEYYFCVHTEKTCPPVSPCDPYAPGGHLYPGEVIYQTRRRRFYDEGKGRGKMAVIDRQITKHPIKKTSTKASEWTATEKEPHKGRYYRFLMRQREEEKKGRGNQRKAGVTRSCGGGVGRGCRRNSPCDSGKIGSRRNMQQKSRDTVKPPTLKRPIYKYSSVKPKVIYTNFRTAFVMKNGKKMVKIFKKIVKGSLGDYDYLEKK